MASNYPAANDSFDVPAQPLLTPLGEAGSGNTRSHYEHHRDLGDAIEALQANVSLIVHDHSGTGTRATPKLNQSNTHQSADTDSSATALHHTLGPGQFQAASGTHNHDGTNTPNIPIASVTNLQSALDSKLDTVNYVPPVVADQMLTLLLTGA